MLVRNRKLAIVLGAVVVAAIVAVVLVLTVGGGGGGKSGPTKADYLARSDRICRRTGARLTPLIGRVTSEAPAVLTGGAGSAKKLASLVSELHAGAADALAQLRAVPEPKGEHAAIRAFLTPLGGVVQAMGQAATVLASGNSGKALQLLLETRPLAQSATSAAQRYGYRQCSMLLAPLS